MSCAKALSMGLVLHIDIHDKAMVLTRMSRREVKERSSLRLCCKN
jgi:hypothetical protein